MQSISDNEFSVINFLIRNFSERFTIRGIAKELNLSAAGVHSILKKLEKSKVVVAEKLGTGLFYNINLNSSVAKHLAAIVLLGFLELKKPDLEEVKDDIKIAAFDGKNMLIVSNDRTIEDKLAGKGFNLIILAEEELVEKISSKDKAVIEIIKKGVVIAGEGLLIDMIKRGMRY